MVTTAAENERLTRVGPGTPGGELLRRYWHPIAPVARLDENPVRSVRLLGEDLVLYRDRSGVLGLIGRQCGHRLVDMSLGIPEEHGLRCPYHGWCYDETGQCTETPLEPPASNLRQHVNIGGYPVAELGGLVWGYLGPAPAPVLPPWDFLVWPNAIRQLAITVIPCNWLQCHENSADPYHTIYLHGHFFKYVLEREGLVEDRKVDTSAHRSAREIERSVGTDHIIFEHDPYGFRKGVHYSVERGAERDFDFWHQYNIFPYYSRGAGGIRSQVNMRVPMDDTHTYHINYALFHAPGIEAPAQESVPYFHAPMVDENGTQILDYVLAQDMAAWCSQGEVTDRSREILGATDLAIIEFRKIIDDQITAVEQGRDPMNVFRDAAELGEIIELEPAIGSKMTFGGGRELIHEGYFRDDADRYGPATTLAAELSRKAWEANSYNTR
jgi:5,5'-dehydrodivanillate O-demethylase